MGGGTRIRHIALKVVQGISKHADCILVPHIFPDSILFPTEMPNNLRNINNRVDVQINQALFLITSNAQDREVGNIRLLDHQPMS